MKLCTIVPLNQKEWMNNRPYTMLLAHLSKTERSYGRWASQLNSYKIMDNSIIELGEAFTLEELLKQALESYMNVQKRQYGEQFVAEHYEEFKKLHQCYGEIIEKLNYEED